MRAGCGNFGPPCPNPPYSRSAVRAVCAAALESSSGPGASSASGVDSSSPFDGVRPLLAPVFHLLGVLAPRVRDVFEQFDEPRPSLLGALREVRPDVERFPLRRQPRRQRPPAAAGHLLADAHVNRVDVRALFSIYLYRHEVLVQQFRHLLVLETLLGHHVTPVAGRVADREEDGDVPFLRRLQRGVVPRLPVYRIVGVLAEIRTFLLVQSISLGGRSHTCP